MSPDVTVNIDCALIGQRARLQLSKIAGLKIILLSSEYELKKLSNYKLKNIVCSDSCGVIQFEMNGIHYFFLRMVTILQFEFSTEVKNQGH